MAHTIYDSVHLQPGRVTAEDRHLWKFTLIELLIVISIIAILTSILLPALGRAKKTAKKIACKSQLSQLGQHMLFYTSDNNGFLLYTNNGNNVLVNSYCYYPTLMPSTQYVGYNCQAGSVKEPSIYRCPSVNNDPSIDFWKCNVSYGYNLNFYFNGGRKIARVKSPSLTLFMLEKDWIDAQGSNYPWYAAYMMPGTTDYLGTALGRHHNGWGNILFTDNHVGEWKQALPDEGSSSNTFWTGK